MPQTLTIPAAVLGRLSSHAEAAYPEECCGILIGQRTGLDLRVVVDEIRCGNVHVAPRSHYRIAPADLASAQRSARERSCEIIGFYHSHPAHPAEASAADEAEAFWRDCSYLILSVAADKVVEVKSYCCDGKQKLIPETLTVI